MQIMQTQSEPSKPSTSVIPTFQIIADHTITGLQVRFSTTLQAWFANSLSHAENKAITYSEATGSRSVVTQSMYKLGFQLVDQFWVYRDITAVLWKNMWESPSCPAATVCILLHWHDKSLVHANRFWRLRFKHIWAPGWQTW